MLFALLVLSASSTARAQALEVDAGVLPPRGLVPSGSRDAAVEPSSFDAAVEPATLDVQVRMKRRAGPGEYEPGGTASRINAPLEELPATVKTVDQAQLIERGFMDMTQALTLVPGVNVQNTYGGFLSISSRGFQALTMFEGRRDGRATLFGSAPQTGLFDVERIEVLRGPASVLYGFGMVGGAVNVIRKRASANEAHELNLSLGTPEQYRAHVGSQGAITTKLSYRVDLGHLTNQNFRGYRTEKNQGTATFRYKPTRKNTLNARVAYTFDRYNTDVGIPTIEDPRRPGRWVLPAGTRYNNRYSSANDTFDYKRVEGALDYRYDFTERVFFDARAAITRDTYSYLATESLTYLPPTLGMPAQVKRGYFSFDRNYRPIYAHAELHATLDTGPIEHQLVGGYQLDTIPSASNRNGLNGAVPDNVSFSNPVDKSEPVGLGRTAIDRRRATVHALYGFDHIKLLEQLILTGGGRVDFVRNRTRLEPLDVETQREIPDPMTGLYRTERRKKDIAGTGQVGLVFTPWQPLITYVSYASAFKPLFVSPTAATVDRYTPERSQQLEGGVRLRGTHRGHALDVDAAGYLIRKKNLLVPRGLDDFAQAGLAQSRGLDLSASYSAPAWVQLQGGYALTDAAYKEFISNSLVTGEKNVSFAGKTLQMAPRHSGNVWLRLLPHERVQAGVGARIMGRQYADDENRLSLPNYGLLDASFTVQSERVSFTLSGNNLLGRTDYFTSVIGGGRPQPLVMPGNGREVLGTLRIKL